MRRALRLGVCVLTGALLLVSVSPVSAAPKRRIGAVVGPVRLVPTGDDAIAVSDLSRYFGRVELKSASDGIVVINRLPLELYLLGLNEVPSTWPMEALKAQAVAARTYALWNLERPPAGAAATYGFDICATVQCQVYSGADVLRFAERGDRWQKAVEDTSNLAVLHRGDPILARYHSTSGGRTFANEQIFPSEGAYPYLKGVESETEEAATLYRWQVGFTLRRLTRILRHGGVLPRDSGRLVRVRTVGSQTGRHYPDVILRAQRRTLRVTAEAVRSAVRTSAPELFPDRYPSAAATSSGRLPEVFPSNRLTIVTRGRTVRVVGRGWGHGVGMSQWGAEGMARRGEDFRAILRHYYTGVRIGRVDPGRAISVGVDWGRSEVATWGSFRIQDGKGRIVVPEALGTWRFRPAGAGAVKIVPPEGHGLPLEVGVVDPPEVSAPRERVRLDIALSRPARVEVTTRGQAPRDEVIRDAGRRKVGWRAPREPGEYEVQVTARAGNRSRSERFVVSVEHPPSPSPSPAPADAAAEGQEGEDIKPYVAAGLLALLVVAALLFLRTRRAG